MPYLALLSEGVDTAAPKFPNLVKCAVYYTTRPNDTMTKSKLRFGIKEHTKGTFSHTKFILIGAVVDIRSAHTQNLVNEIWLNREGWFEEKCFEVMFEGFERCTLRLKMDPCYIFKQLHRPNISDFWFRELSRTSVFK